MKLLLAIHRYDVFMFTWLLNTRAYYSLSKTSRYLSKTGDGPCYLVIMAWLYWQRGVESPLLQAIILGFAIERPVYFVLKNTLKRSRPQAALQNFRSLIIPSDHFSFPSGHTSAAFMMATLLGFFYPPLLPGVYLWALAVGASRIVLGVHFPTDILMGIVLGVSTACYSLGQL